MRKLLLVLGCLVLSGEANAEWEKVDRTTVQFIFEHSKLIHSEGNVSFYWFPVINHVVKCDFSKVGFTRETNQPTCFQPMD